jgi:hypothetical protein
VSEQEISKRLKAAATEGSIPELVSEAVEPTRRKDAEDLEAYEKRRGRC